MNQPTVAIIGAGFSGICAFVQLKTQLGITATVFEKNTGIGGTWFKNTYPGCECDVASHIYSYSFELNPNWSKTFSPQPEILHYLETTSAKYNMMAHTKLGTQVIRATWVKDKRQWQLDIQHGGVTERVYFDLLFSAVGTLQIPNIPSVFHDFKGPVVHTSNWDSSLDYQGKRVALVGSGASAIQVLPYLASKAADLSVFQRTAPWVVPKFVSFVPEKVKNAFRQFPFLMTFYRWTLYLLFELLWVSLGYPQSFLARYFEHKIWQGNQNTLERLGRPDLVEKLKPDYIVGCKRGAFSNDYYQIMTQPHVSIVDVPIKQIQDNTIIAEDGTQKQVDILVLGTGFKTNHGMLSGMEIIGKQSQSLSELWEQELPELYKSTTIHGFPNFFMLLGPYAYVGHTSVVLMAETQVNYAIQCIKEIWFKSRWIEPKQQAQSDYMAKLRSRFTGTSWTHTCTSWYKNPKGQVINLYPGTATRFKWQLSRFQADDYEQ
ncbi:putative flavin-binding monooxygenase-like protein [Gilbertella persicaria]|uniref:putative flavin-binding monooxygenase-like protein n=1 Tax=Gilbertella persicaria TaxID=101096 RepID=UPI00222117F8|nr:putative flavin-binding monooxygenase-like protein [Gilbertella persicaria]KAI8066986.1 putative flavin-binding monooxygenase-like protein [Gilbertella persicaria]